MFGLGALPLTLLESLAYIYWRQNTEPVGEGDSPQLALGGDILETRPGFPVPSTGSRAVILSVLSVPATSASPAKLLEVQVLRPTPDLLNQKFWGWRSAISGFTSMPGDSDARSNLEPWLEGSWGPLTAEVAHSRVLLWDLPSPDSPKTWLLLRASLHPMTVDEKARPLALIQSVLKGRLNARAPHRISGSFCYKCIVVQLPC